MCQISEVKEAVHLHDMILLREMNLLRNPVQVRAPKTSQNHNTGPNVIILYLLPNTFLQDQDDCRLAVIFLLQHLIILDQHTVTAEEKVIVWSGVEGTIALHL